MFSVEVVAEAAARQVQQVERRVVERAVAAEAAAVAVEVQVQGAWVMAVPSALEVTQAGAMRLPEARARAKATSAVRRAPASASAQDERRWAAAPAQAQVRVQEAQAAPRAVQEQVVVWE